MAPYFSMMKKNEIKIKENRKLLLIMESIMRMKCYLLVISVFVVCACSTEAEIQAISKKDTLSVKNGYLELMINMATSRYSIKNLKTEAIVLENAGLAIGFSPLNQTNYKTPPSSKSQRWTFRSCGHRISLQMSL